MNDVSQKLIDLFPEKYRPGFKSADLIDLIPVAKSFGVSIEHRGGVSWEMLLSLLLRGPVTALVDYSALPLAAQFYPEYDDPHAITIWRVDLPNQVVEYADPFTEGEKGASLRMLPSQFWYAWSHTRPDGFKVARQVLSLTSKYLR